MRGDAGCYQRTDKAPVPPGRGDGSEGRQPEAVMGDNHMQKEIECPCDSECLRYGDCVACFEYHQNNPVLPTCMLPERAISHALMTRVYGRLRAAGLVGGPARRTLDRRVCNCRRVCQRRALRMRTNEERRVRDRRVGERRSGVDRRKAR